MPRLCQVLHVPSAKGTMSTILALCGAWEVQAFPLSPVCIRCVGASFKAGHYRSAGIYFQTAVTHQLRGLGQPVFPFVRAWSVRRGLGPATLKYGFDVTVLAKMIDPLDARPFRMDSLPHVADMMIISCWYMLREIEVSSARDSHLALQGDEVQLLVPVHKTNTMGSLTTRLLQCACGIREHCVLAQAELAGGYLPLFPQDNGASLTKHIMTKSVRMVLSSCGIETTITDDSGRSLEKFAHFLAAAGIQLSL